MKGYIYKITNIINDKVYIGQTRQKPQTRFSQHKNAKDNCPIHAAFRKYGIENFKFEIIKEIEFEDKEELIDNLNVLEIDMIKKYNSLTPNGYNIEIGGNAYNIDKYTRCKNTKVINDNVFLPKDHNLLPRECFIFLLLQLYAKNSQCNTSYKVLHEQCGLSINTLSMVLKNIENKGYITINKTNNSITYIINKFEKGEPFSYDFLDNKDISFTTKSYLVASQQYMYKDIEGLGKMSYSNHKLSDLINMPESTIRKCDRELKRKNYLEVLKNEDRDLETGCQNNTKVYKLKELGQAVIWLLQDHEERIQQNTEEIEKLKKQVESQNKIIEKLLKKQLDECPKLIL